MSAFKPGPVLTEFGAHAAVPGVEQLPADTEFAIAFDVSTPAAEGSPNRGFDSAARFLNMHVANGVPQEEYPAGGGGPRQGIAGIADQRSPRRQPALASGGTTLQASWSRRCWPRTCASSCAARARRLTASSRTNLDSRRGDVALGDDGAPRCCRAAALR